MTTTTNPPTTDDATTSDPTRPARPVVPRWLLVLVALLAVLALAVVAVAQVYLHQHRAEDDRRGAIAGSATKAVDTALSYDYHDLQGGIDATEPLLTGDARSAYEAREERLLSLAPQIKGTVRSEVKGLSVLDADDDSGRLLMFVDQYSTRTKVAGTRVDRSRVLVAVDRRDGRWLVSAITPLSNAAAG